MLAIDTNIVIRYLTNDNVTESTRAKAVVDKSDTFVSLTVLLETEWVLRSVYGFRSAEVCDAIRAFAGLPRVKIEDEGIVAQALALADQGLDFADALHLGKAQGCEALVSFDQRLIKKAKSLVEIKVRAS